MLPCFRKCSHHNIGTGCWNWKWLKSYAMRQGVSMDKQENQENRSLSLKLHNENLQYLQLHQLTSSLPLWRLHQITPHDINARGTFLPLPNSISAPFPESWVWKVAKYDHLLQALGSDWKSKQGDNTVCLSNTEQSGVEATPWDGACCETKCQAEKLSWKRLKFQ